ncbi:hypothetical protein GCM10025857_47770 [Alicyclobacillus contaminans]|nr:cytochrome ubiquinol oxidase subunit I [Alicyclobacillus fastidiosus]GMA53420.1 hypothetical protein GCM10025857_47770 [Alicyclobacillus contaminans]GMA66364.1 hypothetical protein GCM10025859_68070 [Alicyclobacillus fastidiosus]GMA72629.1 hypothetical protein GCM10025885_16780 [Tetragenococcus osmophilus]
MLWTVGAMTFAPFIANTCGWLVTELGRYPWTVYGMFKMEDSVSPNVTPASLLFSNIVYFLLFGGLAVVMFYLVVRELRKGPDQQEEQEKEEEPATDPFDGGAFNE